MDIQERFLVEDSGSDVNELEISPSNNYEKVYIIVIGAMIVAICIGLKFVIAY